MRNKSQETPPIELLAGVDDGKTFPDTYREEGVKLDHGDSTKRRNNRSHVVERKITSVALIDNKYKTWRNLLRPRYIRVENGNIKIIPASLNHQHIATLSSSGGPYFATTFTLPLSRNDLQDAEYWPEGKKRGYCVDLETQWDMLRYLFRVKPEAGIYIISSETRGLQVRQIIFTLLMHTTHALNAKHVRWAGLYSTHRDSLRDDKPPLDVLVLGNLHSDMDQIKLTKLRDLLHIYSSIPVFLAIDGEDPLAFAMKYLHVAPRMVLNIGMTRLPKYIKSC